MIIWRRCTCMTPQAMLTSVIKCNCGHVCVIGFWSEGDRCGRFWQAQREVVAFGWFDYDLQIIHCERLFSKIRVHLEAHVRNRTNSTVFGSSRSRIGHGSHSVAPCAGDDHGIVGESFPKPVAGVQTAIQVSTWRGQTR